MAEGADAAEHLRLQGNDAFATKDWERALELYQRSIEHGENVKTYSNLAATLCKLARFDEASIAAKRATTVDPTWAKAWWRRGVVTELRKFFAEALKYYSIAVELDPKERTFRRALASMEKRLGVGTAADGTKTVRNAGENRREKIEQEPTYVAWSRLQEANPGGSTLIAYNLYASRQENFPTSEQWLVQGLVDWLNGLKNAVASLTTALVPEARGQYQAIQQQQLPQETFIEQTERLLGGIPDGMSMQTMACGFAHLGGLHVPLETGGTGTNPTGGRNTMFCPQPRLLSFLPAYQNMALLLSIEMGFRDVLSIFGKKVESSEAVLSASSTFYGNLQQDSNTESKGGRPASPEEAVAYIKKQLQAGKTWNGGLRKYVSLQYRGTILFAIMIRFYGQVAECYKWEQWARKFITLADKEFKVSEQRAYEEKGSAFRPSFRIGMMMSEFHSLTVLRGEKIDGPYSMGASLDLCMEMAEMARTMEVAHNDHTEYSRIQNDVGSRRKPLALAHSAIASQLNTLENVLSRDDFDRVAIHHGLIGKEDGPTNPFALIAKHYGIAAEAELPDANQGALYWWGCAASMARAGSGYYNLGELRSTIVKAEEADRARDVGLFGVNKHRGATFETLAKLTARHYQDEPDSFVLPEVMIVNDGSNTSLRVGNEVLCHNYSEYVKRGMELHLTEHQQLHERMDTTEIEKVHGVEFEGVPSLETLCVRELHKRNCEYAVGETDGAVIYCKALLAGQKEQTAVS